MSHKRGRGQWSSVKTTNLIPLHCWLIFHPTSIRNGLLNVSKWRICRTNVYDGQYHSLLIVDQSVNNMVDGLSHTVGLFSTLTLWCCLQVGVDAWLHDKVLKKVSFFSKLSICRLDFPPATCSASLKSNLFGRYLLRLSGIKCSWVMSMGKYSPNAPNFGYVP